MRSSTKPFRPHFNNGTPHIHHSYKSFVHNILSAFASRPYKILPPISLLTCFLRWRSMALFRCTGSYYFTSYTKCSIWFHYNRRGTTCQTLLLWFMDILYEFPCVSSFFCLLACACALVSMVRYFVVRVLNGVKLLASAIRDDVGVVTTEGQSKYGDRRCDYKISHKLTNRRRKRFPFLFRSANMGGDSGLVGRKYGMGKWRDWEGGKWWESSVEQIYDGKTSLFNPSSLIFLSAIERKKSGLFSLPTPIFLWCTYGGVCFKRFYRDCCYTNSQDWYQYPNPYPSLKN